MEQTTFRPNPWWPIAGRPPLWLVLSTLALAITIAVAVAEVSQRGIGLSPDSRSYVMAADSIAAGRGVYILNGDGKSGLFTHLAPGLSIILGIAKNLGVPAMRAALLVNMLCVAASVMLIAALAWAAGRRSPLAALAAAAAIFIAMPVLRLYGMLGSEPPFMAFMLMMMVCLAIAIRYNLMRWVLIAAVSAAIMASTRYAGAALIGSGTLLLLWQWQGTWKRRFAVATAFFAIAAGPILGWLAYGAANTARLGNREIGWHMPRRWQWREASEELIGWIVPRQWHIPTPAALSIFVGIVLFVIVIEIIDFRRYGRDAARIVRSALWLTAACYAAFILVSITLFDAYTPLDERILLPVRLMLVSVNAAVLLATVGPISRWRPALAFLYAGLIGVQAATLPAWISFTAKDGLGFNARMWRDSPVLLGIDEIPTKSILYCNVSDAVYLLHQRFSKPLPILTNLTTNEDVSERYYRRLPGIWRDLRNNDGRVLFFHNIRRQSQVPEAQFVEDLHLIVDRTYRDGVVYRLDPTATGPRLKPPEVSPEKKAALAARELKAARQRHRAWVAENKRKQQQK